MQICRILVLVAMVVGLAASHARAATLQTQYARIEIDEKGFVVSLKDRESGKDYVPIGRPSPLLSLHEDGQPNDKLVFPIAAVVRDGKCELKYPNGTTAVVTVAEKETYFRFQLLSLTPRGKVDDVVWGPMNTTISGKIGDIIGVVRTDDWAIGLYGLDDNTIAGPPTDGDCYTMGYYVHSPDPVKHPLPPKLKEGQRFNIGGDGKNDVAFFSHGEPYFQMVWGTGAKLEPEFGSSIAYHSRDRRKSYVHRFSLIGGFKDYRPRHQVTDPVPGVDFIGSAVALYACPDDKGLATLERIFVSEKLPRFVANGKWIRDPSNYSPTVNWSGRYDKAIEYTEALGLKAISRESGEFYANHGNNWTGGGAIIDGKLMSGKDFKRLANAHGMTFGGLHTMTMFLQGGISHDVTPVPSERLQTICRTKLAKDISEKDTDIVVADPSFLAEKGTWPWGDGSNYIRIGGEMLRYDGISEAAPWTLKGVKRGHASKATPHKAGDELVKLQQNGYNGFVPDMQRLPDYSDYYADLMARNGLEHIGFDGLESTVYQGHGYYAVRVFLRRLFETYGKMTDGNFPRVTGSCVFPGSWEYMSRCDIGGGDRMFSPMTGRLGTQGRNVAAGWSNSYFPATFGIQHWHSDWSLYDAENLQAKSIGWHASYAFQLSQEAIDQTGDRDAIFKAFRAWERARAAQIFTKAQKERLRDPDLKFHLEEIAGEKFVLYPIKELRIAETAGNDLKLVRLANPHAAQSLQFALQFRDPIANCTITLPDGGTIKSEKAIGKDQFIICTGRQTYVADKFRKKIEDLPLAAAELRAGDSQFGVQFAVAGKTKARFNLTVWIAGNKEVVSK